VKKLLKQQPYQQVKMPPVLILTHYLPVKMRLALHLPHKLP
jgi:hypothetical protein